MKIYTKTGDGGETGLFGGPRVRKDHARIEAYGDVDELNATLGVARTSANMPADIEGLLERIQHELFALGAELATPDPLARGVRWIGATHIAALEADIDRFEESLAPLQSFILPAGSAAAAALHQARCVCRRSERRLVTLMQQESNIADDLLIYLNRLSDLLFVLARAANQRQSVADVAWQKPRQ